MFPGKPDFIARLFYLTTEQGGRKTPAFNGYRPHIEFGHKEFITSGQQVFLNKEQANPGEEVEAEITILSKDKFKKELKIGIIFKFCEGSRIVGFGEIIQILNKELELQ